MKNNRRIIGIVAATVLALVGTLALVTYVRSATDDAVADETLVDVYVVDEFVPKGAEPDTIMSAVSVEQVPARLIQAGALTDLEQVGEQVAASDLQPGDQLLAARLATKDLVTEEVTDKVQVSALLEAERAVGGALKSGDLVGVYLSFDPFDVDVSGQGPDAQADTATAAPTDASAFAATDASTTDPEATDTNGQPKKTPNVSRLEFRNVLVTNVQTTSAPVTRDDDNDDDEPTIVQVSGTQYVVTIALSPEESERFVFAKEFGKVWLSLDPATVADDGTRPVTFANVYTVVK
jgi:pilus assembly protein CpaB